MAIGSNRNINKAEIFHQNTWLPSTSSKAHVAPEIHLMKSSDDPIKETKVPTDNQKMLVEKHNHEELANALLIVGTG